MDYSDPYSPPVNPLSPRVTQHFTWRVVGSWAFGCFWRAVVLLAGVICGGIIGCRLLLPPPPPPGEFGCGNMVLGAVMVGIPGGAIVGALVGLILIRAIQNEARPMSARAYPLRDGNASCQGQEPRGVRDWTSEG